MSGALWGAAALPATALIAVTQGVSSSLGWRGEMGMALVGWSHRKGVRGRHGCWDLPGVHICWQHHAQTQWRSWGFH